MAMITNSPPIPLDNDCAVCGELSDAYSHSTSGGFLRQTQAIRPLVQLVGGGLLGNFPPGGKFNLLVEIMGIIRTHGRFEVNGLEAFWKRFDHHLCSSCRSNLERRQIGLSFVRYLLQEALRLDPGNDQARKNLDIIS